MGILVVGHRSGTQGCRYEMFISDHISSCHFIVTIACLLFYLSVLPVSRKTQYLQHILFHDFGSGFGALGFWAMSATDFAWTARRVSWGRARLLSLGRCSSGLAALRPVHLHSVIRFTASVVANVIVHAAFTLSSSLRVSSDGHTRYTGLEKFQPICRNLMDPDTGAFSLKEALWREDNEAFPDLKLV